MAENLTLARPYANAVFEYAVSKGHVGEWQRILEVLAMIAEDKDAKALIANPAVQDNSLLKLLSEVSQKALPTLSPDQKKEVDRFITVLVQEKRLNVLHAILSSYQQKVALAEDLKKVTVTTAFPISPERQAEMTKALSKFLHSKVEVDFREDAALIGGAVIRSGNWVMDGSIKGKLQNLKDSLLQ